MKTFKQILAEARAPAKPKGPPKKMEVEIDPKHLGDGTNDRGISFQVLHDLPAEHGKLLDTLGGYATKPGVRVKQKYGEPFNSVDMQSRGKRVGAWLSGSRVSYFPSDMASHGSAKKFTVAAEGKEKSYPVHVSWNSRDHATVHYHGNEPLTDEEKNAIVNHDGLNRNFKKITLQTDQ
jgi:hypothetical protein